MGAPNSVLDEEQRAPEVERPMESVLPLPADPVRTKTRSNIAPLHNDLPVQPFFQGALLEQHRIKGSSKAMDLLVAIIVHAVVIAGPIFTGLYFTDTLNLKQLESTFLVAPPPPPPPPPAPAAAMVRATPSHRVFESAGKLIAPTVVPKQIAEIKEAPLVDDGGGVPGGVPGGVAGGSLGGVIGGVIGGMSTSVPPPLAPKVGQPKAPVRVGGNIRAPKPIIQTKPDYPVLARQTHIQGVVVIEAIIDEHGYVQEMKIVSGPPILYQAALGALSKWRYEPTYLNDQPVPVQLLVTITFQLSD
jgi:periplasmic protein TonB